LQIGCFEELSLLGSLRGGRTEEREIHFRFASLHARGEWFRLEEPLRAFIAGCAEPQRVPAT
jgi:hypothetical protein